MDVYDKENKAFPGGNPVNVAVYVARLGGEPAYIGPVGTDAYGAQMMDAIASKGVDISHMKVQEGATAVTHVEIVDGDRVLGDYDEGVMAGFRLTDADLSFISGYDMLVTGLWGMIENDLPEIQKRGVPVAFDFADRPDSPIVEKTIGYVDYAFVSMGDADDETVRQLMRRMKARGPRVVVVTRGSKGSVAYDGQKFYTYGIVPCEVVDTMGAGDSFIAGFLYAICEGKNIQEAMAAGAVNSSITIGYEGAW